MAKVRSNLLVQGLSGKLGDQVVFRQLRDGRTIVCKKPDFSRRKLSRDQKAHHARVKEAAIYARDASKRQPIYAELAAGTVKNAYNVAFGDWFNPPVIDAVERRGNVIRVKASDDAHVAGVRITILDEAGKVLETGEATREETNTISSGWWRYTPAATGRIVVEVRDLAGNVTRGEG